MHSAGTFCLPHLSCYFLRNDSVGGEWMNVLTKPKTLLRLALALLLPLAALAGDLALYDNAEDGSPILNHIARARRSIDMELYEMTDPTVQGALVAAAKRGISVRILLEPRPVGKSCDLFPANHSTSRNSRTQMDLAAEQECRNLKNFKAALEHYNGKIVPFNKELCGEGSGLNRGSQPTASNCFQHGKIVLIDRQAALMSTGNLNPTSLCAATGTRVCNRDFTLAIANPNTVGHLVTVFELDWVGIPYSIPKSVPRTAFKTLTISPFSLLSLLDFIESARSTIEIEQQYLKDPQMNEALYQAALRGVKVRILVASFCSFGPPSETESQKAKRTYTNFEQAGAEVRIFSSSIKIKGRNGYLHAKAIVVDGKAGWVGSVNGSTNSLTRNREYGLFFSQPNLVAKLRNSFKKDFTDPNTQTWQESLACVKDFARLNPVDHD